MRGLAALALVLGLGGCGPKLDNSPEALRAYLGAPENEARVDAFVLANVRFTLYHELGHFLVEQYQIGPVGDEELVADRLAIHMLTPPRGSAPQAGPENWDPAVNPDAPALLWVIWFWNYRAQQDEKHRLKVGYFDSHPPNVRRAGQMVCLLYGSDPDRFEGVLRTYGGDEVDAARCVRDAEKNRRDWSRLMVSNTEAESAAERFNLAFPYYSDETSIEDRIDLDKRLAPAWHGDAFLKQHKVLEEIAEVIRQLRPPPDRALPPALPGETPLEQQVRWEREQQVEVLAVNGLRNATWDPDERRISIGYPLVYEFVLAGRNMLLGLRRDLVRADKAT